MPKAVVIVELGAAGTGMSTAAWAEASIAAAAAVPNKTLRNDMNNPFWMATGDVNEFARGASPRVAQARSQACEYPPVSRAHISVPRFSAQATRSPRRPFR